MLFPFGGKPVRRALTIATTLVFFTTVAPQGAAPAEDEALAARVDPLFTHLISPGDPGAAVLVQKDGKVLFEKGYGVRELRAHTKIDLRTNFRLASVTKQFTAMAIMLLIHDGKLHYHDPLTAIFPEFPAYGESITVENLLTHTSGLPDYEEIMEQQEKNGGSRWSVEHQIQDEEVLALLEAQPAGKFLPGTRWEYSNSGYVVLGLMVRRASGMTYGDFLKRRIFTPLQMQQTVVYEKGKNTIRDRAYGHSKENGRFVETDQSSTSATLGDGGIYSSVEDMAKWDEGLRNHVLLSQRESEPALRPVKLADGDLPRGPRDPDSSDSPKVPMLYGFGWFLDPYDGHARSYHNGSTMGFRTAIERFVDDHFTVIVLSNRTDLNPEELSREVADFLFRKK
jgi:CubicO group peptidase (beta-lactamase class C family)